MGHPGKHIIDPETGLCELCDEGAIREVYQGKRPGKQILYSNSDDQLTSRSNNDEIPYTKDRYVYKVDDEPTPRYVRKPLYPVRTVQPRRVVYEQPIEEPIYVRRKGIRRNHTPPEDVIVHRPPPRPKRFYHVDQEGQIVHQNRTPPPELPRRYVVQSMNSPPARTVRVQRRQLRTPPPPKSEPWHNGPRRQINSDTEIIERQRMKNNDPNYRSLSPIKPEMYYLGTISNDNHRSPTDSPTYISHDINTPPPKVIHARDRNRKQIKAGPLERRIPNQPSPTVVRRVYKKLPPSKIQPHDNELISNENHPRSVRKTGKNFPPPKHYQSSPQLTNRSPEPAENPTIYYMRSVDEYE